MSNNHALASSPVLDSPSKVYGLIFLNSPSRWSVCFLFLFGMVLSSAEGVPSDELSPSSVFTSEFLEALLLTSSSWLSSFGIFLVTILCSKTSFISCCFCCAFFNFSLSTLKTYSSTIRFLIVSNTSVGELPSLFCLISLGGPCCGFSSILIYAPS
jgi:hypothetical protein